mgnify:CR=1 FL=1
MPGGLLLAVFLSALELHSGVLPMIFQVFAGTLDHGFSDRNFPALLINDGGAMEC